jgi:hypothetical protein
MPASPLPTGATPTAPSTPGPATACGYLPQRAYRLTPAQVRLTLVSLLGNAAAPGDLESILAGTVPDTRPFSNLEPVLAGSPGFVEAIVNGARSAAVVAMGNLPGLHPCFAGGVTRACVGTFVSEFGARAWRRGLTSEETAAYLTFFDGVAAKSEPKKALEYVVRRLLSAPDFLFRFEVGGAAAKPGTVTLTPEELASALAYTLTNAPPDATLVMAAASKGLDTREGIEAQAGRLLDKPESGAGLLDYFGDLFDGKQTGHPDQPEELRRFVSQVIWSEGGKLATLLTADFAVVNPALQKFYGWTKLPAVKAWEKVTPPSSEARAGLLTHGLFLSRETNRSARGTFIKSLLMCAQVPDPPQNVVANLEMGKADLTAKLGRPATEDEAREAHMTNPACSTCHKLIDPLGKPLSAFDRQGLWVAQNPDTKKAYDTSIELTGEGDIDGRVADPRGLARALAASKTASDCMARHTFEFLIGRPAGAADECHVRELATRLQDSGGDVRKLFVDVVASEAFRLRRVTEK